MAEEGGRVELDLRKVGQTESLSQLPCKWWLYAYRNAHYRNSIIKTNNNVVCIMNSQETFICKVMLNLGMQWFFWIVLHTRDNRQLLVWVYLFRTCRN